MLKLLEQGSVRLGDGGRYRVIELLGEGGMGNVYLAEDERLSRRVAIKCLTAELSGDGASRLRFRREVKMASKLCHPNLVRVLDYGFSADFDFYVQEFVEGSDLEEIINRHGPISFDACQRLKNDLALVLYYLHSKGIVHRDIKPANVMFDDKGQYRLMDFGLAYNPENTRMTETNGFVGTLRYLPPEVRKGFDYTPASDVYQYGLLLHTALTGGDASLTSFLSRDPKTSLGETYDFGISDVPSDLRKIVINCCSLEPTMRPDNGAQLLKFIEANKNANKCNKRRQAIANEQIKASAVVTVERPVPPVPLKDAAKGTIAKCFVAYWHVILIIVLFGSMSYLSFRYYSHHSMKVRIGQSESGQRQLSSLKEMCVEVGKEDSIPTYERIKLFMSLLERVHVKGRDGEPKIPLTQGLAKSLSSAISFEARGRKIDAFRRYWKSVKYIQCKIRNTPNIDVSCLGSITLLIGRLYRISSGDAGEAKLQQSHLFITQLPLELSKSSWAFNHYAQCLLLRCERMLNNNQLTAFQDCHGILSMMLNTGKIPIEQCREIEQKLTCMARRFQKRTSSGKEASLCSGGKLALEQERAGKKYINETSLTAIMKELRLARRRFRKTAEMSFLKPKRVSACGLKKEINLVVRTYRRALWKFAYFCRFTNDQKQYVHYWNDLTIDQWSIKNESVTKVHYAALIKADWGPGFSAIVQQFRVLEQFHYMSSSTKTTGVGEAKKLPQKALARYCELVDYELDSEFRQEEMNVLRVFDNNK